MTLRMFDGMPRYSTCGNIQSMPEPENASMDGTSHALRTPQACKTDAELRAPSSQPGKKNKCRYGRC